MATKQPVLVEVNGISKSYRQGSETITAVSDVSLTLYRGELVAVVGPSGSGKTTLAHMLGGLAAPDSGTLRINGKTLKMRSDAALSVYRNQMVGFVFQNFNLLPHYTALENVLIPQMINGVAPAMRREQAKRCLNMVGLLTKANRRANQLSGGERQRVSIARALVNSPRIIIADEPTGSLDSKRAQEIMAILETLCHKHGVTVLMVTHDDTLARRADRQIRMADGAVQKEARRASR